MGGDKIEDKKQEEWRSLRKQWKVKESAVRTKLKISLFKAIEWIYPVVIINSYRLYISMLSESRPCLRKKMAEAFDYVYKLVFIGESTVGKSALLLRFAEDTFNEAINSGVGKAPLHT